MADQETLPDNPLKKYRTYSTYFIVKLGRRYKYGGKVKGYQDPNNILLLDTRGNSNGNLAGNESPMISVRSFDINHQFEGNNAKTTIGLDATLIIYERGGASYMNTLGQAMGRLGVNATSELVYWLGAGIIGWSTTSGGREIASPINEKWFPLRIKEIEMNMRNSGSEYTHWMQGWKYVRSTTAETEVTHIKETIGTDFGSHMKDLMNRVTKERQTVKQSAENIGIDQDSQIKDLNYTYSLSGTVKDSFPISSDTTSMDTGGISHVSSGGEDGTSTVINHIKELIKHSPDMNRDLVGSNQYYKVLPEPEMDETTETINYRIASYNMKTGKDSGLLPLRRFNYFFGGRNEDVLEFDFTLKGDTFTNLGLSITAGSVSEIQADNDESSEQGVSVTNKAELSINDEGPKGARDNEKNTEIAAIDPSVTGNGLISPLATKKSFNSATTREMMTSSEALEKGYIADVTQQLVDNSLKIKGDPNLILDEETVDRLGLEGAANYIVLSLGIPGPEFPNIPEIRGFIFSGDYRIKGIKSVFSADGTFHQELDLGWIGNLEAHSAGVS